MGDILHQENDDVTDGDDKDDDESDLHIPVIIRTLKAIPTKIPILIFKSKAGLNDEKSITDYISEFCSSSMF